MFQAQTMNQHLAWIVVCLASLGSLNRGWCDEPAKPAATVAEIAKQAKPAVVVITYEGGEGRGGGLGTGFIISADGLIATNFHVIDHSRPLSVHTVEGQSLQVLEIHALDKQADLAILRVSAKDLPMLELADAAQVEVGSPIVALGNPLGLKHSVVAGVISAFREVEGVQRQQIAMPVEPGNSGGPVLNMHGKVVGIVSLKSLAAENIAFAIPADKLKALLEKPDPISIDQWVKTNLVSAAEWTPLFGAVWRQRGGKILAEEMGEGFGGRALCLSTVEPPPLPFELAVSVKLDDESGAAGLAFHADGGNLHYGFYPTNGKLRLSRFDGPDVFQWKVLEEKTSEHYRPGEWNNLKARIEKGKLLCYVNDQLVIESTDDKLKAGKAGLAKFRQTKAQFQRFEIAASVPARRASAEISTKVAQQVERLPRLNAMTPDALLPLAETPAESVRQLREKAREQRRRAGELERLAGDVRLAEITAQLAALVDPQREKVDLLRAALTIARLDDEDLEAEAYIRQVDRMAAEIRGKLPKNEAATAAEKLAALNQFLFKDQHYRGSKANYYSRANSHLGRVIDDREGIPITLSVLYMELGSRLGLKIEGVGLPSHFVVRHLPQQGSPQLIDVYGGGLPITRDEADQIVRQNTGEALTSEQEKPTNEKQILLRMLHNLLSIAEHPPRGEQNEKGPDQESMLRYLEAMLAIDPELIRERGLRAVLRYETGREAAAIADLDWFLEKKPAGLDLEQIRELQERFRQGKKQ